MKKVIPLLILTMILIGCSKQSNIAPIVSSQLLKVVDIRVHSNYEVVLNGESTSFYVLTSFLQEVEVDSSAKVRVFFNEESARGILTTIHDFIREQGLLTPSIQIFSEQEFEEHLSIHAYIDILQDERVLFNGKDIHPENLPIALQSGFDPDSTTIYLTLPQDFSSDQIMLDIETLGFSSLIVNRSMYF
jgi:hypothetical protein